MYAEETMCLPTIYYMYVCPPNLNFKWLFSIARYDIQGARL